MSWRGYLKLLGLMIIPLALYHVAFHVVGDSGGTAELEKRLDALTVEVTRLAQQVEDMAP